MTRPIDELLARLDGPRPTGRDRWRCACPVCGGRNRSTLSVGVGDADAVLLKCWKEGCGPEQIARAIGLEFEDLFPPRDSHAAPEKRRRMLSDRQALELLERESLLAWTAAQNLAAGHTLTPGDLERLSLTAKRIGLLTHEVRA